MSDLIDRRETMQALVAEYNRRFMAGDKGGLKMAWIEKAVDDVPSAQPERKMGEWQEREDYNGDPYYTCTSCGESWYTVSGNNPYDEGVNFCPNCGADMRE